MIEWRNSDGITMLLVPSYSVEAETCYLCKKLFSGQSYKLHIIEDHFFNGIQPPRFSIICHNCLQTKEFYFLNENNCIQYNFVVSAIKETTLSKKIKRDKGSEL